MLGIKLKKSADDEQVNKVVGDEFMTHKKNKWRLNVAKLIVALLSIVMLYMFGSHVVSNYDEMEKRAEKQHQQYVSYDYLIDDIQNFAYSLQFEALKQQVGVEQALSEMIELEKLLDGKDENQQRQIMESLADNIESLDDVNYEYDVNLQYYITDGSNEITVKKLDNQLTKLVSEDAISKEYQQLINDYVFFMEISFDSEGNVNILHLNGGNEESVYNYVSDPSVYVDWESQLVEETESDEIVIEEITHNSEEARLKPLKNIKILAAVSKNVLPGDQLYHDVHMNAWAYEPFAVCYILFFASLIGLFVIIMPYKILSQFKLLNGVTKIPFELLLGALSFLTIGLTLASTELIYMTQTQELRQFFADYMLTMNSDTLTNAVNLCYWFLLFTVIYIDFYVLKHMVKVGIFTYIKENTITFIILKFIKRGAISAYRNATDLNLKDKNTKQILILLTVNFVLVSMMCSIWFFGIIAALIYSVVVFFLVIKLMKKVNGDYARLSKVTHALSSGVVDVSVEEDLGYFNDLRDEMQHIQAGFKKAVAQEVKSQKMKTDLIANVSHDLKTPLTSIVTYVDLLKNPNLSEELRTEYVETLDRKADRLKVLIEDLFEMSKASSGNVSLNLVEVDVVSLMKQTLLESEDKIMMANLIVRRQFPEEKVLLHLDSQRMYRVFENLILNMTKYAMPSTRAYIEISDLDESVQITFRNMSAEEITFNAEDIVERFVRGDSSRHTEGSGLGLAISKSFVELQGGQFEILVDGDLFKVVITFTK